MNLLPETLTVLGIGPSAVEVALRDILRFKTRTGAALVLDATGRGAMTLSEQNKMSLDRRPIAWWDLADRRRPTALFQLKRSPHLRALFLRVFRAIRAVSRIDVADATLLWACEAAYSLSADGSVGLGALLRCLATPETRRWFLESGNPPSDLGKLLDALTWALSFPAVYGISEGANRARLLDALRQGALAWIEMPSEHFEPREHGLVHLLAETATEDALRMLAMGKEDGLTILRRLTVLHLYPHPTCSAPLSHWVSAHNGTVRHVGVQRLDPARPLCPLSLSWVSQSEFLWVAGPMRPLKTGIHSPWLTPEETTRVETLGRGDLWVRANRSGKAVTARFRVNPASIAPAVRLRAHAARRRTVTPVEQVARAARALSPSPRSGRGLYARLCDPEVLRHGWLRAQEARGKSHGVDGVTLPQFGRHQEAELESLAAELKSGQYKCQPLRRIEIPKMSGGVRNIGIACVRDRVVQSACLALLEPIFEPTFSRWSFAFRPRRNAHQAVAVARSMIAAGRTWVVIADIRNCFDTIDHDVLLHLLARHVADDEFLALVHHWLTADVLDFKDLLPTEIGIPQGEAISPLFANVYLTPLDRHFERLGYAFVRYADDIVIFSADEEAARRAFGVMGDFLRDSLRLELKPTKTAYVPVSDGFDFLGFRMGGNGLAVQSAKLARLSEYLTSLVKELGAPGAQLEQLARSLGRLNAVIRGWRNYFLLSDEPIIAEQMRTLDERAEELAAFYLPASLRDSPAWLCRERFSIAMGATEEDRPTAPAQKPPDSGLGYPVARDPPGPVRWMVHGPPSDDGPSSGGKPAQRKDPAAEDSDDEPPEGSVLEEGQRLYILTHGAYVTVEGEDLVLRKKRAEIYRCPLERLALVYLQGFGISVSVDGQVKLASKDVPVVFSPPAGNPIAVLNPIETAKSSLRRLQAIRRDDPEIVAAGLSMIAAKVANQAAVLKYFAKYRRKVTPEIAANLVGAAGQVQALSKNVLTLDAGAAGVRTSAMGFEGHAAALYWRQLAALVPQTLGFSRRITTDAEDPVNQCLNYVYGVLYGEVWRAVVKAGLDPYFGLIHGSLRDQGSLVFDLIEEFRAPFADRLIVGMAGRGFRPEVGREGLLRTRTKHQLVRGFTKRWLKPTRWSSREITPAGILTLQARRLGDLFRKEGRYKPFRMKW